MRAPVGAAWVAAAAALAACGGEVTTARIALSAGSGVVIPAQSALEASVYGPSAALRLRAMVPGVPMVPGTLVLVLPDVEQKLRVVVRNPASGAFGGAQLTVRTHQVNNAVLVLSLNTPDADGDGVPDALDDCPQLANPDQTDLDQDGQGDLCDATPDGGGDGAIDLAGADLSGTDGGCESRQVSTFSGSGVQGFKEGPPQFAQLDGPMGIAAVPGGGYYLAERNNNIIRFIDAAGNVSLYAGMPPPAAAGHVDGVRIGVAQLSGPAGLAIDGAGDLYVSEMQGRVIRKISAATGMVSTVSGAPGGGLYLDGPGNMAVFLGPRDIAVDGAGNLYVTDMPACTVRKVAQDGVGTTSTLAGMPMMPGFADSGTANGPRFQQPMGLALAPSGDLIVADSGNRALRRVTLAGVVTTVIGGPTTMAFPGPVETVRPGAGGELFVGTMGMPQVVRVSASLTVSAYAGNGMPGYLEGNGCDAQFQGIMGLLYVAGIPPRLLVSDAPSQRLRQVQ